jgi:predicted nuclease of predicted toxin-antitoxin system
VFGEAFRLAGYAVVAARELGMDATDDLDIIPYCGDNRLIWVTEDLDARRRGQYVKLVRDHQVSAVLLRPPAGKGWSVKVKFEVIARNLRTLEQAYQAKDPRYYLCTESRRAREVPTFSATFRPPRRK